MDLTKIEKPFGLLDKDTQEALKDWQHGWETYNSDGWVDSVMPVYMYKTYRAKPAPVVKEMTVGEISKALGYEVKVIAPKGDK